MPHAVASRRRTLRSAALLTSGVLALPVLAGCSTAEREEADAKPVPADIGPAGRDLVEDGGTLRWAVDAMPATLNAFQADADAATSRITGAALPSLFTLDDRGRAHRNPDFLESAETVTREPKHVVLYKLNQQAVWSDGREIGAPDFVAQWKALSGKDTAYWTARNSGYDRIEKIERGASDLEVRVTFAKPYADWQSLFTPLYPKEVMGSADTFNDGARSELPVTAGPFKLQDLDRKAGTATLVRNPRWWGERAKLESIVLRAVPRDERAAALATGTVDMAEIDKSVADRIALAVRNGKNAAAGRPGGAGEAAASAALKSWAKEYGSDEDQSEAALLARGQNRASLAGYATEQKALRAFVVRKTLEPAYTQLALNGESGPLADERVRRAVARALNRKELAEAVLKPLGLPAQPVGSHLALAGQAAYADNSGALGDQDTEEAQALLADAGWTPEGAGKAATDGTKAGAERDADEGEAGGGSPAAATPGSHGEPAVSGSPRIPQPQSPAAESPAAKSPQVQSPAAKSPEGRSPVALGGAEADTASDEGLYVVSDGKPGDAGPGREAGWNVLAPARAAALQSAALRRQADILDAPYTAPRDDKPDADEKGGVPGAYAPVGTRAPAPAAAESKRAARGPLGKDGQPLSLRFVLPSGPGSEALRTVGNRIARMLDRVGIRTEITKVADESFFKDHIASGDYDLALYSWPATAFPATDARPIFAKPVPASDGSLLVEQNYTRVGTDHIDQLFAEAIGELDEKQARELMKQADARIWAAAGSIPLYQRPQLVAVKGELVNAGAFGFATPRYQDIGFKR
ncbi:ABC transporter family substrate-binding protein [Streptomyces formicae]|uniref:ABC transporter family substrate-binding protein n=1 Tax=Streptomyces formicae TaxID=1616117 RepID=A0ABY3WUM8_9ACTN|nr:ABC transporter family substrate-binding protein [Streptomyces formicae]UNM16367.1 ABC transporter family substrate-binding protein [Streptomyces formicae]